MGKISQPCGVPTHLAETVGNEDVLSMVQILHHKIESTQFGQCRMMSLASLPPLLNQTNMLDLHLSLTSVLSHLFFIKMDWRTSRGGSCDQIARGGQKFRNLVGSWQSLTCLYLRSSQGRELSRYSDSLEDNIMRVLNTRINLYTSCQARSV